MSEAAATPRPAASLILTRGARVGGRGGLQVLMGRRPDSARFMPGVWVFPGGGLEPALDGLEPAGRPPALCARRLAAAPGPEADPPSPGALAACALREAVEETGLSLRSDAAALRFAFRAVTPPSRPIRFDARFLLGEAEALCAGPLDAFGGDGELGGLAWLTLDAARDRPTAFVTGVLLEELAAAFDQLGAEAIFAEETALVPLFYHDDRSGARIEPVGAADERGA